MRILALDGALARCSAGVVADGGLLASRHVDGARGHPAALPELAAEVLRIAGIPASTLDAVAVTLGPGSFTGLRAAISWAHGLALAAGCPVVGVTLGEALAEGLPHLGGRQLWTVIDSRRDRVFLERDGVVETIALADLPRQPRRVALAGDAGRLAAAWLAAREVDVLLTDAIFPQPRWIAAAAEKRLAGALPPREALPLYVDPPEVRAARTPPRPAPADLGPADLGPADPTPAPPTSE